MEDDAQALGPNILTSKHIDHYGNRRILITSQLATCDGCRRNRLKTRSLETAGQRKKIRHIHSPVYHRASVRLATNHLKSHWGQDFFINLFIWIFSKPMSFNWIWWWAFLNHSKITSVELIAETTTKSHIKFPNYCFAQTLIEYKFWDVKAEKGRN